MHVQTLPEIYYPENFAYDELFCGMTLNTPRSNGFDIRDPEIQKEFEQAIAPLVLRMPPKQLHGGIVQQVKDMTTSLDYGDGLVTNCRGIILGVRVADCTGVVLFDQSKQVVSALHAGWRGCKSNIAANAVLIMKDAYACNPSNIHAHLFPVASVNAYEVGKDVAEVFSYPNSYQIREARYYLDMHTIITHQLIEAGLPHTHITRSEDCTIANTKYHSFRRDGKKHKCMLVFSGIGDYRKL